MQRIGEFELKGELGRGAMGVVYRAHDPRTGRDVALKVLLQRATHAGARERLQREGEISAALVHPNVVRVHSASEDERGRHYLAYELIERCRTLAETTELPLAERLRLLRDAARGLGHAHARGVTHRDVKAENILVTQEGVAKVTDFGIAAAAGLERLTQTGAIVGTPSHMAPEQVSGEREAYGPPTDVWALGVVLYELLTGEVPFPAASLVELIGSIQSGDPRPPSQLESRVPPALDMLCLRCLRHDPAQRHPDADAFADDLDHYLRGEPFGGDRRWGWRLMAGVGVGVGVLAAFALLAARSPEERAPAAQAERRGIAAPRRPVREAPTRTPRASHTPTAKRPQLPTPKRVFQPLPLDRPLAGEKGSWVPALRAQAAAGDPQALVDLAWLLGAGTGVEKSYDRKLQLMHDAAHLGHPQAQCYMGHHALRGQYVEGGSLFSPRTNPGVAAQWFRLALASGDREAARQLLALLRSGREPAEAHEIERLEPLVPRFDSEVSPATFQRPFPGETEVVGFERAAAQRGNSGSMLTIARWLDERGERALALTVLRAAGSREQCQATFRVAQALEKGELVERDPRQAAYWYRRAAALGQPQARQRLVELLEAGELEPLDPAELPSLRRRLPPKLGAQH